MRLCQTKNLGVKFSDTLLLLINKSKTYFQLGCLFMTDCTIYGSLNFLDGMLTARMDKRGHIKCLSRMLQNLLNNGT